MVVLTGLIYSSISALLGIRESCFGNRHTGLNHTVCWTGSLSANLRQRVSPCSTNEFLSDCSLSTQELALGISMWTHMLQMPWLDDLRRVLADWHFRPHRQGTP